MYIKNTTMTCYRHIALVFFCSVFAVSSLAQKEQEGLAGVINDDFEGSITKYGIRYSKVELTCAHGVHPYGALLRVTNLENKRSTTVRVIDKGPFISGRIIELSGEAGKRLGIPQGQQAMVRVELISQPGSSPPSTSPATSTSAVPPVSSNSPASPVPSTSSTSSTSPAPSTTPKGYSTEVRPLSERMAREANTAKARLVGRDFTPYGLYEIELRMPEQQGWGVQLASHSNVENVLLGVAALQAKGVKNVLISIEKSGLDGVLYKYIAGPYASKEQAEQARGAFRSKGFRGAFVVNLARGNY